MIIIIIGIKATNPIPINSTFLKSMFLRDLQPAKALSPITLSDSGKIIPSSFSHKKTIMSQLLPNFLKISHISVLYIG